MDAPLAVAVECWSCGLRLVGEPAAVFDRLRRHACPAQTPAGAVRVEDDDGEDD